MTCEATQPQLTRYALQDLDQDSAAMVTAHLESCRTCRAELTRIERTLDLLCRALAQPTAAPRSLSPEHRAAIFEGEPAVAEAIPEKPQPWIFRPHRALAAAAGVLIMLGVTIALVLPSMIKAGRGARSYARPRPPLAKLEVAEEVRPETGDSEGDIVLEDSPFGAVALRDEPSEEMEELPEPDYAATPPPPSSLRLPDSRASKTAEDELSAVFSGETIVTERRAAPVTAPALPKPKKKPAATGEESGEPGRSRERDRQGLGRIVSGLEQTLRRKPSPGPPARPTDGPAGGAIAAGKGNKDAAGLSWYWGDSDSSSGNGTHSLHERWEVRTRNGRDSTRARFDEFRAVPDEKPVDAEPDKEEEAEGEAKEKAEGAFHAKAFGVSPFRNAARHPFSTFSIDVDTASYTLARNYMSRGLQPPAEAVRTEEFVNFFDYGYKAPEHETFHVFVEAAPSRFGRGLHLLKIGVKGRRLGREEQRPAMLTFLIDTSGSMDQADRLGLVRKSLRLLVEKLGPADRIAIVQYDSHARMVLAPTPASQKKKVLAAVDGMQCGGSTNLEEGMARAYAIAARNFVPGGENRVLLLSDGVANLGAVAAEDILKKVEAYRKQGITCSVFGFGMGSYDDEMLETLANKGDGNYAFVDSEAEARRVFVDDLSATLNTIAADVKIQVEFNPRRVKRYRQLGYENRQLKDEQFRDDTVDAGEVGSGQSVTALYELEFAGAKSQISDLRFQNTESQRSDLRFQNVGVVRVRYRRLDTGAVEEIAQPIRASDVVKSFREADARFRLAACVAEFAELLRGSPFAVGNEHAQLAAELRPVALELQLDTRVQELLRLVSGASSLGRSAVQ